MAETAVNIRAPLNCASSISREAHRLSLAEVIIALRHALDLSGGYPRGHGARACWIGMHIGRALRLDEDALSDLYYTLLLKDAGCSSNAARLHQLYAADDRVTKQALRQLDTQRGGDLWRFMLARAAAGSGLAVRLRRLLHLARNRARVFRELVMTRCERGAEVSRQLGFGERVAAGVLSLDEHWNGRGGPHGLRGEQIPLASRITLLAQVADTMHTTGGRAASLRVVRERAGRWFDPEAVLAFESVADEAFWLGLTAPDLDAQLQALEPESHGTWLDDDGLDAIAEVFAQVVDAKSPYTRDHSSRVAGYAEAVGRELGLARERCRWLRRAALLHDIGKLGVSNTILDKPDRLSADEWRQVRGYAQHSEQILARIGPFRELAMVAGRHHERLDGRGYPQGLRAAELTIETRIVTVADMFDAITAERPQRAAIATQQALALMEKSRDTALDGGCLDALRACVPAHQTFGRRRRALIQHAAP